jgi:hypothetical protein
MSQPRQSEEIFGLALSMLNLLRDSKSPILDVHQLLADWGDLLLAYTTFEVSIAFTASARLDLALS